MLRQLTPLGIEPILIQGADREDMLYPPSDYDAGMANTYIGRQMGLGEIGCLLGHLRAFQQIVNSGEEYGHILEDDCVLTRDPRPSYQRVIDANPGARLILGLSTDEWNSKSRVVHAERDGYLELTGLPYGAFHYVIHRKLAAQAIIHLRQSLHMPGDVYFKTWVEQNPDPGTYFQIEALGVVRTVASSVIGDEARMHNFPPSSWAVLEINDTCPLLIHQISLGPKEYPHMDSWAAKHPKHLHKVWGHTECTAICDDYGVGKIYLEYCQKGFYPGAADIARYCILHRYGGLYADADSQCLRRVDIRYPFLVMESETYRPGLLCNGFIQTKANDPLMMAMIKRIATLFHPVPWCSIHQELGPGLLNHFQAAYPRQHMPSGLFLPKHFEGQNPDAGDPYCVHQWDGTFTTNTYLPKPE